MVSIGNGDLWQLCHPGTHPGCSGTVSSGPYDHDCWHTGLNQLVTGRHAMSSLAMNITLLRGLINITYKDNLFYALGYSVGSLPHYNDFSTINVYLTLFWLLGNALVIVCSHANVQNG